MNPPLPRIVAALPILFVGCETDWTNFYDHPGSRAEFRSGDDLVRANGYRFLSLLCLARWVCIPFSLICGYFIYRWASMLYGGNAGLFSLGLWTFEPNLLAHAELVTPDSACTSFGIAASYFFWRWLRNPTWAKAALAGLALGLAQLSKLSWLILFGLWPLLWAIWLWTERRKHPASDPPAEGPVATDAIENSWAGVSIGSSLCQLLAVLAIAVYLINVCYLFDGTLTPLEEYEFVSQSLSGLKGPDDVGNRFRGTTVGQLPVPLPRQYVLGFDCQKKDLENYGQPSFLRGEWRDGGWWYYYLYGLLVKVPCGIWGLLALVVGRRAWGRLRYGSACPEQWISRDEAVLLAPAAALLVVVSAHLEFNHHLRYVFPCLAPLLVFLGQAIRPAGPRPDESPVPAASGHVSRQPWVMATCLALATASAISALQAYPHHLAYFNEFVGGPANGHLHLLGSSVDWGQDLRPLCRSPDEPPENALPYLLYYGRINPADLGVRFTAPHLQPSRGESVATGESESLSAIPRLPPGRYIVSRLLLSGYGFRVRDGRDGWLLENDVKAICRALARYPVRTTLGHSLAVIDVEDSNPVLEDDRQPP